MFTVTQRSKRRYRNENDAQADCLVWNFSSPDDEQAVVIPMDNGFAIVLQNDPTCFVEEH